MTIAADDRRHGRQAVATDIAAYALALLLHLSLGVAVGLLHHGTEGDNRQTQIELVTLPPAQSLAATSVDAAPANVVQRLAPAVARAESVVAPRAAALVPDMAPSRPQAQAASRPAAERPSASALDPTTLAPVGAASSAKVQAAAVATAAAEPAAATRPEAAGRPEAAERPEAAKANQPPDTAAASLSAGPAAMPAEPPDLEVVPLSAVPIATPLPPADASPSPVGAPNAVRAAGTVTEPSRAAVVAMPSGASVVTTTAGPAAPAEALVAASTVASTVAGTPSSPSPPAPATAATRVDTVVQSLRPTAEPGSVTAGTAQGTAVAHASAVPVPALAGDGRAATTVWSGDGGDVRAFLKGYDGGCFIAVASQIAEDSFAMSGFSRTAGEWVDFNRSLDRRTGYRFAAPSRQVSQAQCAALAFARRQPAYPDFALRIALESDRLRSGEDIAGRIEGVAKPHVVLLLVDDEGRVQDVSGLMHGSAAEGLSFRTPLTLTSGPVETVQLFVAIASASALPALASETQQSASDYFEALSQALASEPDGVDVALAAFSVE